MIFIKKTLDEWLNDVDYTELNSCNYMPSKFALMFMNFIKLVNGSGGESHKTPPFHLKMLDKIIEPHDYIANLVFRGGAKTSLFMEYMTLYIATFGDLPNFGKIHGMLYVSDSMENGVKSARKNIETRYLASEFLQEFVPHAIYTDPYLEFRNKDGHQFGVKMFGARTGIRGTKIFAKRPTLVVLDDLMGDKGAESEAEMKTIKNTLYKGVVEAVDPTQFKIILNGTPFNKSDVIVEAVESGGWHVNVWPVAEVFPCKREEFVGAWDDRFSYDVLMKKYQFAVANNEASAFAQELMLRITAAEDRLIQDAEILWRKRATILANKHNYNFYITSDFATSKKKKADYSVLFVWSYDSNGDWTLVDGFVERQTMDKNINLLFKFVFEYAPQSVGIEISGQQGAFIDWIRGEMNARNIWFNFASSDKTGATPGIRSDTDKLRRFNVIVPQFKAGKIYFALELKESIMMGRILDQISLTTLEGIKGKDDCIDAMSQLGYLKPWKPIMLTPTENGYATDLEDDFSPAGRGGGLADYLV